jgi:DNA-directed RNA polymerase subunit RPC12/RpoP
MCASSQTDEAESDTMGKKIYKCFTCGKVYDDEARAVSCHGAPVQQIVKDETRRKPKFLGN